MLHSASVLLLAVAGLGDAEVGVTPNDAVLVEFSSKGCNFCRQMEPVIEQIESEGVAVRHVDVDREPAMAVRYRVRQLPTFVVMADGKEAGRLVGMQSIDVVRRTLAASSRSRLTRTGSQSPRLAAPQQPSRQRAADSLDQATPKTHLTPVGYSRSSGAAAPTGTASYTQPAAAASPSAPSGGADEAVARAEAATVRLRVHEEARYGVGSGTIIDAHGEEMLVLTCGHLFRESKGKARIEVDVFHGGQVHTVPGQLVDYNAKDRDIALVAIKFGSPIQPVPVMFDNEKLRSGQSAFSFGCDRGADPSCRNTRITGIDKYNQHLKLSNVEIAGAPIDGRSGGGLFDAAGRLIGVCNAADYDDDIGIYAGPGEVYWQLARVRLEHLFRGDAAGGTNQIAAAPQATQEQPAVAAQPLNGGVFQPASASPAQLAAGPAVDADDREVIVIVRDRKNPTQNPQIVTFDTAPAALMQILQEGR